MSYEWIGLILAAIAGAYTALARVWRFGPFLDKVEPMPKDFTDLPYLPSVEPVIAPVSPVEPPVTTPTTPNPSERLYDLAFNNIGNHLSLNIEIPVSLGCADTISWLLLKSGYPIPKKGIPTVAELTKWMTAQGFVEEKKYGVGYIITGRNSTTAHIGICGKDWIISNTSFSDPNKKLIAGLFQANYQKESWVKSFPQTRFFRLV